MSEPKTAPEMVGQELIQLKYKIDMLKEQYAFFTAVKQKAMTQNQILDTIEHLIEPHLIN